MIASTLRPRSRRKPALHSLPVAPPRLTIAWTLGSDDELPTRSLVEVELAQEPTWLAGLKAGRCREVVLTAHVGDDVGSRHRVLELAERLTFELAATQPLIRVRFAERVWGALGAP